MRSFVVEPMQYGRLFLAGDAAHIVPPTGAKGMNLADRRRADAGRGARRLVRASGRTDAGRLLATLPAPRLAGRALLVVDDLDAAPLPGRRRGFQERLQLSQLRYLTTSRAAATSLAENYVGLENV